MADAVLENEETRKKSVLEEKSKEELIKIVAKQLNLLKKAKGKSDDLSKRCQALEKEKQAAFSKQSTTVIELQLHIDKLEKDYSELAEKNNKIIEEKDLGLLQLKESLKAMKVSSTSYLNETEEQIQCLTMQLNTVKETCQCLQSELTKFQTENQEQKKEIQVLTEARDHTLQSLKSLSLCLESKTTECEDITKEMNELKNKYAICIEVNCSLSSKMDNLEKELKELHSENSNLVLKVESATSKTEFLSHDNEMKTNYIHSENDFSFLITDNQKLLSEVNSLKDKIHALENESRVDCTSKLVTGIKCEEFFEIKKENEELLQNLYQLESTNVQLKKDKESLENKNLYLDEQLVQAKAEKLKTNIELDSCLKEKLKLTNEIKVLTSSLQQFSEFKTGFEHALLHGAESDHLTQPLELYSNSEETATSTATKVLSSEGNKFSKESSLCFAEKDCEVMGGLEFGLLGGGSITETFENFDTMQSDTIEVPTNRSVNSLESNVTPDSNQTISKLVSREIMCTYEELQSEKDFLFNEISTMKMKYDEYASLLQETLNENESLKLKLESIEKEKHQLLESFKKTVICPLDIGTNTENELHEESLHSEKLKVEKQLRSDLEVENDKLNKQISLLQIENSEYGEKCSSLTSEIELLKTKVTYLNKDIHDLEAMEKNSGTHLEVLEKQNYELNEKLEKKCSELEELNFQLELLIISIKQGVRQKTSGTSNKAEKPLQENITLIKNLLDDLIIKCNTNAIKIKTMESNLEDLIAQKQASEYEVLQMKELNQFLEDEARELRIEVEQLKSTQACSEEYKNDVFYEQRSVNSPSELYSIDETDEKTTHVEPSKDNSVEKSQNYGDDVDTKASYLETNEQSVLKVHSSADFSIQVNIPCFQNVSKDSIDLLSTEESFLKDAIEMEDTQGSSKSVIEDKCIIESLTSEISHLKSTLSDKTNLVERIHCQLDSLLENIETLNIELKKKDSDLKSSQCLILKLQEQILQYDDCNNSEKRHLKNSKDVLSELNSEKDQLKSAVLLLKTFFNEAVGSIDHSISCIIDEYNSANHKYVHLEKITAYIKSYLCSMSTHLNLWSNAIHQANDTKLIDLSNSASYSAGFLESLENSLQDENSNFIPFETKCNDDCCTLAADIEHFNSLKQQFFSILYDYLKANLCNSVAGELDEYKTNIVPNLKATISNLEYQLHEYLNKNMVMSDSMSEQKMETSMGEFVDSELKSQLADKEIKMNKFKQIALKMKKELMESKKQNSELLLEKDKYLSQLKETEIDLEKVSTEQLQYVQNYQSLQNEYDKIQDELEIQRENAKKLEGDFSTTLLELNSLKEKIVDLESQLMKSKQMLEASTLAKKEKDKMNSDLESKLIIAESKIQEKVQKVAELETAIKDKIEHMYTVAEENTNLKQRLEASQKEEKKKNLMDLEMADYEWSILDLNNKIQRKDDEINELKSKLTSEQEKNEGLLEEIKSTETLKETEEKRVSNLKEVLEKTKYELALVKERETELSANVSTMKMQLEVLNQQEENCKLQLSETSSEIQHLKEMIKTSSENHQRIVRSLESKISTQKQEILLSHKEVENIKQEFENYKIRVHSVLKQQKSSNPALPSAEEDLTEKLETVIDKLKLQVKDLNEKLTAVSMEYEALQEEHDILLQRYNKAITDKEREDNEWHIRLEQINAEKSKLRTAQEELSSQHLLQNEMLVSTYKKQIKIMSDEHKRTVNELQKQLESADLEIARLQRDQQKAHGLPVTPTMQDNSISFDILSQERQEGEGSESIDGSDTPIRNLSLSTIPTSGFLPLEKLLQSPLESSTPKHFIQYQDCEKLVADLNASNKHIEHLSEVLNESESTNLRLSEQVRVLKEEVRRLERNKEREEHAENLEYLKNVFIKFSTLNACSEKAMLIPVLTTMLKLSPSEQQQLKSIAGDIDPSDAANTGWGSYLHRWSGLA